MGNFAARPLTPDRWEDLVTVFGGGDGKGDCGRCWCMWWRLERANIVEGLGKKNKARFKKIVVKGPPPGLVGYDGKEPVGWVQVCPRPATPGWNAPRRLTAPADLDDAANENIWGISCFVVRAGFRRRGYFTELLDAAIERARSKGAAALDACPVDAEGRKPPSGLYHGLAPAFHERGFVELARRRPDRPLMRLDFGG